MKYVADHIKVRNDLRRMDVPEIETKKGKGLGTPTATTPEGDDLGFSGFGQIAFDLLKEAQDEAEDVNLKTKTVKAFSSDPEDIATEYGMSSALLQKLNEDKDLSNLQLNDTIVVKAPPIELAQASGGGTMTDFDTMIDTIPDLVESVASEKNKPAEFRRGLGMPPARPKRDYKGIQTIRDIHKGRFGDSWNDETFDKVNDWMTSFESDNKNVESKSKSSASGFYQVTDETGITYANRMENALTRNFIPVPQFVKDLQDGSKRMIDLSRDEQQALFENNMFEQEGSDENYIQGLLKGGQEGWEALQAFYLTAHHTRPTDVPTAERIKEPRFVESGKRIFGVKN